MKLQNCFTDDNQLRRVFSWLTRIGAAPKFGSRHCGTRELKCSGGTIFSRISKSGKWIVEISVQDLFTHADNFCRTGKF